MIAACAILYTGGQVAFDVAHGRRVATHRTLTRFASWLERTSILDGRVKPRDWASAVRLMSQDIEDPSASSGLAHVPMLASGRDAWDRPFIYDWREGGRYVEVRSAGPNGRDERGDGDDIRVVIDLRWAAASGG